MLRALLLVAAGLPLAGFAAPVADTLAQRVAACSACHGDAGRATAEGYYPRIAGKPAGYLLNQLQSFRDGRRRYAPMNRLLARLPDRYLAEISTYFASLDPPYPKPEALTLTQAQAARARMLVDEGDARQGVPACRTCHGTTLTGTLPAVPGLVGLSRDYINAQLGAWINGTRRARAPDCMGKVAQALHADDVAVLSNWLAAEPIPASHRPAATPDAAWVAQCGSMQVDRTLLEPAR